MPEMMSLWIVVITARMSLTSEGSVNNILSRGRDRGGGGIPPV